MLNDAQSLTNETTELRAMLRFKDAEIHCKDLLIEKLKHQLAGMRHHRFGASSEALDQLALQLEQEEIAASVTEAEEQPLEQVVQKDQPKRKPLPDHLPREELILSPKESCTECGGKLKYLGEDVTEELEYVPGRFKVNRIIRPKLSCACCDTIHQAPLPSRPIERGRPGPGLLSHVLVSKYADHLPLYRQSQIFEREQIELSSSTLADWVGKSTHLLEPLAEAIGRHVRNGKAIFADDTPVGVLAPGNGKTKTGRIWAYVRDERAWNGGAPQAIINILQIARVIDLLNTWPTFAAGCMRMVMQGLTSYTVRVMYTRSPVWRMCDVSSLTFTSRRGLHLQPRP
ncbi:MAG: IS66 family transposase [Halopseudomonas aestusnigri]